jgi:hypothetical protein
MDGKKLAKILPLVVGIGLCVVEGLKAIVLLDSAHSPNAASGHTEPALFAPEISTSWSYITPLQMMILALVTGAVLLLAVLMFVLQWRNKLLTQTKPPGAPSPSSPRMANGPRNAASFGRARKS